MEEHKQTREIYDRIADWEDSQIVISKHLVWSRFGILSIMGDYVLRHVREGDIVEIGIGESSIMLTKLAKKYRRHVYHCDVRKSEVMHCSSVTGVLDRSGVVYTGTSDDFFNEVEFTPIALGFIDGDHTYDFVKRDFDNLFDLLVEGGYIFMHDMYPPSDDYLHEYRCGDGYRLRQQLERRDDVDIFTFPYGAMEVGFTMVRKLPKDQPHYRQSGRRGWIV